MELEKEGKSGTIGDVATVGDSTGHAQMATSRCSAYSWKNAQHLNLKNVLYIKLQGIFNVFVSVVTD